MKIMHRLAMASRPEEAPSAWGLPPCQMHPKYGLGRFVWLGSHGGTTLDPANTGIAVWDFDTQNNKWRPNSAAKKPTVGDWDGWKIWRYMPYAMVSASRVIAMDQNDAGAEVSTANAYRAVIDIDEKPRLAIRYGAIEYAGQENVANIRMVAGPAVVGYDGKIFYIYNHLDYDDTSNGWVNVATADSFLPMSGSVRSVNGMGTDAATALAFLGGTSPNGFFVVSAAGSDYATWSTVALVDCNGTPVRVAYEAWEGYHDYECPIFALSASKVIAMDKQTGYGAEWRYRANLICADSATTPTTLTRTDSHAFFDDPPPAGCGYARSDVCSVIVPRYNTGNMWCKDGAVLLPVIWKMYDNHMVAAPAILRATGTSLSVEYPTTDIAGSTGVWSTHDYYCEDLRWYTVGAPGDKASLFFKEMDGALTQQTFQL